MWHFFFHNAGDNLAESLTAGRERPYLQHFYARLAFNQDAIGPADLDRCATSFAAAGAMRAGFELYRAFDRDGEDNGGASSFFASMAEAMLGEVAKDVTTAAIPECGHWIAEENPGVLLEHLLRFAGPTG